MTDLSTPPSGGRAAARRGAQAQGSRSPADARIPAQGGRAAARKAAKKGKKKALKIAAWSTAGVVGVVGSFAGYEYVKLNGNISSSALHAAGSSDLKEKTDAFGRSPINILVMGSDARATAADCKLGGACGADKGERADVEMVVHISADRSNATVMSIPRDLVTELPSCAGGGTGMINSALDKGEGCQVNAVEKLTDIPIDHFVKISFSGVVSMSDAVGGVKVCVTDNVYDPDSHLKLKKGSHTLKGQAALEFVRTRHGFGDGSDIGRTVAQHIYLSAAIKAMKSAGSLTDPTKVLSLANAATKALKVDDGLGSIPKLIGLADDLNKVPTSRITFTTMQYIYGTGALNGRVLIGPNATRLFQSIANDTPLTKAKAKAGTGASASASAAATTAAAVSTSSIAVRVENGTTVPGRAGAIVQQLVAKGFSKDSTALTGSSTDTTTLTYPTGKTTQAKAIASALGLPSSALKASSSATHYTVVIGTDWKAGAVFPSSTASVAAVSTKEALAAANAQTSDKSVCAPVGHQLTVVVNHRAMTPVQAYSASTGVKDSAP